MTDNDVTSLPELPAPRSANAAGVMLTPHSGAYAYGDLPKVRLQLGDDIGAFRVTNQGDSRPVSYWPILRPRGPLDQWVKLGQTGYEVRRDSPGVLIRPIQAAPRTEAERLQRDGTASIRPANEADAAEYLRREWQRRESPIGGVADGGRGYLLKPGDPPYQHGAMRPAGLILGDRGGVVRVRPVGHDPYRVQGWNACQPTGDPREWSRLDGIGSGYEVRRDPDDPPWSMRIRPAERQEATAPNELDRRVAQAWGYNEAMRQLLDAHGQDVCSGIEAAQYLGVVRPASCGGAQ